MLPACRVAVFIDGAFLYHVARAQIADHRIAVSRFGSELTKAAQSMYSPAQVMGIYYYTAPPDPSMGPQLIQAVQRFTDALRHSPYVNVRLGRLDRARRRCASCGTEGEVIVQKGVDMAIAMDVLALAYRDAYDLAILVTSDGDFSPLIQQVRSLGKNVWVAFGARARSQALNEAADFTFTMTDDFLRSCVVGAAATQGPAQLMPGGLNHGPFVV